MLAEIGLVAGLLSFLAALYAVAASVYGERFARSEAWVISGRNAVYVTFVLITTATVALQVALMTEQYQIAYVWSVSSPSISAMLGFSSTKPILI